MQIDLRVLELLSSKLCHDLVSPISAISNGVELIEDIGGSVVDEAMKLIGDSSGQASRRLRLFRVAYGRAGSEDNIAVKDVRQIAMQYLASGKINIVWPEDQPLESLSSKKGSMKVLLNLLMMSEEILAYGGTVSLHSVIEEAATGCRIDIVGRSAQLTPAIQDALEGTVPIDDLTPRTIQSYITGRFTSHFGLQLKYDQSVSDRLEITLFTAKELP